MPDLLHLTDADLVPVIELEPGAFHHGNRESPPYPTSLEAWERYWRDSLADAGIVGLDPISPGAWQVSLDQFVDETTIDAILSTLLNEVLASDERDDAEFWPAWSGGAALVSKTHGVIVRPQCCCSLFEMSEWQKAAEHREATWKSVWVGHPWIHVRFEQPYIIGSHAAECDRSKAEAEWSILPEQLLAGYHAAREASEAFSMRLIPSLEQLGVRNSALMSRVLAGLERP